MEKIKYLITGLGNIGPEYRNTRHNIGFNVLDAFAKASNAVFEEKRHGAVAGAKLKGRQLVLLKPNTFMNNSGRAVNYWMEKEKVSLPGLLVIGDDIALPFGAVRLRASGSDGGHNGLKSINEWLGTRQYARLRVGIGNDFRRGEQADYVLSPWAPEEEALLPAARSLCEQIITSFILVGAEITMSTYNNRDFATGENA